MKNIFLAVVLLVSLTFSFNVRQEDTPIIYQGQQCLLEKCNSQLKACQTHFYCAGVMTKCGQECKYDPLCWQACVHSKGNQLAIDLTECAVINNCFRGSMEAIRMEKSTAVSVSDPISCIKQKCPNEWDACQKDPKCVPTLQDCQKKCGGKNSCWQGCLAQHANPAATNAFKCGQANGCIQSQLEASHTH